MTLPTVLTLLRIALIPALVLFAIFPAPLWVRITAATIFAVAAITDVLDGFLARRWKQATEFGAFLDPVADKLLVVTALVILVYRYESLWITLPILIIVGREIAISALREWMAGVDQTASRLRAMPLGKWKTFLQMSAVVLLLAGTPDPEEIWQIRLITAVGYLVLYLAAIQTVWSMLQYLDVAWPSLRTSLRSPVKVAEPAQEVPPKSD